MTNYHLIIHRVSIKISRAQAQTFLTQNTVLRQKHGSRAYTLASGATILVDRTVCTDFCCKQPSDRVLRFNMAEFAA
jgi:hypothetical protein